MLHWKLPQRCVNRIHRRSVACVARDCAQLAHFHRNGSELRQGRLPNLRCSVTRFQIDVCLHVALLE